VNDVDLQGWFIVMGVVLAVCFTISFLAAGLLRSRTSRGVIQVGVSAEWDSPGWQSGRGT
jgi:hypothetical protein